MLRSIKSIIDYNLLAKDGEFGKCKNFLFEDDNLAVRYLEANAGNWLLGRLVLLAPASIKVIKDEEGQIEMSLSKEEIKNSPALATHEPVSMQYEKELHAYFGWPYYWAGNGTMGAPFTPSIGIIQDPEKIVDSTRKIQENHLRSFKEV